MFLSFFLSASLFLCFFRRGRFPKRLFRGTGIPACARCNPHSDRALSPSLYVAAGLSRGLQFRSMFLSFFLSASLFLCFFRKGRFPERAPPQHRHPCLCLPPATLPTVAKLVILSEAARPF